MAPLARRKSDRLLARAKRASRSPSKATASRRPASRRRRRSSRGKSRTRSRRRSRKSRSRSRSRRPRSGSKKRKRKINYTAKSKQAIRALKKKGKKDGAKASEITRWIIAKTKPEETSAMVDRRVRMALKVGVKNEEFERFGGKQSHGVFIIARGTGKKRRSKSRGRRRSRGGRRRGRKSRSRSRKRRRGRRARRCDDAVSVNNNNVQNETNNNVIITTASDVCAPVDVDEVDDGEPATCSSDHPHSDGEEEMMMAEQDKNDVLDVWIWHPDDDE